MCFCECVLVFRPKSAPKPRNGHAWTGSCRKCEPSQRGSCIVTRLERAVVIGVIPTRECYVVGARPDSAPVVVTRPKGSHGSGQAHSVGHVRVLVLETASVGANTHMDQRTRPTAVASVSCFRACAGFCQACTPRRSHFAVVGVGATPPAVQVQAVWRPMGGVASRPSPVSGVLSGLVCDARPCHRSPVMRALEAWEMSRRASLHCEHRPCVFSRHACAQ